MKLSVIIVNYNVKYFLELCLHSVFRSMQGILGEVIVVDNNSTDDSTAMVRRHFPQVVLVANSTNLGFSKANNQGVARAKGEYILFLNPDTVMPEDFLQQMLAYMDAHPKAGAIGPRLIDGKGVYSPDGKKSFPSLSVALFKTSGLNRIFSKSPYFNKYYAVHIGEHETAEVEGLSGCCMLVRASLLPAIGGAFDEDYFMYCEDVDLCYRIQQAGYKNIYFPEVTLIHYKGESTRKATLSYVRVFNEALVTFVKKHYSRQNARLFVFFINIGIVLRAVLGVLRQALKALRMPLFDALVLLATLWFMKEFWVEEVKSIAPIPLSSVVATFPVYISLWILSLYFNGAYDQPYRGLRVIRGMLVGTVIILAYYGLLQPGLRYSRAIIVFSGFIGTVGMLGLHELLYRLGIFKFIPYDRLPHKAVIVANPEHYAHTADTLRRVHYAPELAGRIGIDDDNAGALAPIQNMKELLFTAHVNEVIFCVNGLSYQTIFRQMQHCGPGYEYKIHLPGSESFVGSNSAHTSGDLYTLDKRFHLSMFAYLRNKRVLDIFCAGLFLLLSPLLLFFMRRPGGFLLHAVRVLLGKRSWVGYAPTATEAGYLPPIKPGVLPPYHILKGYEPGDFVKTQLNLTYAQNYKPATDLNLLLSNFKYLGGF